MKPSGVTHECIRKTSLRAGFQTTDMIYELVSYTTDKAGYLNESSSARNDFTFLSFLFFMWTTSLGSTVHNAYGRSVFCAQIYRTLSKWSLS